MRTRPIVADSPEPEQLPEDGIEALRPVEHLSLRRVIGLLPDELADLRVVWPSRARDGLACRVVDVALALAEHLAELRARMRESGGGERFVDHEVLDEVAEGAVHGSEQREVDHQVRA